MRRNQRKPLELPRGAELIAVTYGVGKDDYLCVVLAYQPHVPSHGEGVESDQFATWVVNVDVDPHEVGEGHYMPRNAARPGTVLEERWIHEAWLDFESRSRRLYRRTSEWFEWERKQDEMGADGKDPGESKGRPGGAAYL